MSRLHKLENVVWVDIKKLKPHPKNRNKHPKEQIDRLSKILMYQGFRKPIVVSNRSGFIVEGHGRVEAAKANKWTTVPVSYQDFEDETQEYAHLTADNAIALWAELDMSGINADTLELGPFDTDLLGIQNWEPVAEDVYENKDADAIPEIAQNELEVQLGDIYQLGDHRLMCGDSTDKECVEKLMDGQKADMVFTDPPYNVASDSKNFAANVSKSMKDLSESKWDKEFEIEPPIINAVSFSKDSATYYIWTSHYLFNRIIETLKNHCDFISYLVWAKPNPMPSLSKRHPTWNTELCVYGTRGTKRIVNFPNEEHFLSCRNVIKKSDGSHPTQKPLELIEPLIEFSSGKKQLIMDLFLGSGSTLIACEKTNRKCYGMELNPHYCSVIIKRWQDFTGKSAIKL